MCTSAVVDVYLRTKLCKESVCEFDLGQSDKKAKMTDSSQNKFAVHI